VAACIIMIAVGSEFAATQRVKAISGGIAKMPIRKHQRILIEMPAQTASRPSIVTLPSSATVDQVVEVLHRDGGVIIADMLDQGVLDRSTPIWNPS
jgi:hypothetical protein